MKDEKALSGQRWQEGYPRQREQHVNSKSDSVGDWEALITKLAKSNWKRSKILAEVLLRWGERGIGLSLPGSPREERERLSRTTVAIPPPPPSLQL